MEIRRRAPSWLWDVSETKRKQLLAKRSPDGTPHWTIPKLSEMDVLRVPFTPSVDLAAAKVTLLAELSGAPITTECNTCHKPMSPERFVQQCADCQEAPTNKRRVVS